MWITIKKHHSQVAPCLRESYKSPQILVYLRSMIEIVRATSDYPEFLELVKHLDAELATFYGDEQTFYEQFNKLDQIKHAIVAYDDGVPVACGALKHFSDGQAEVKRMFTLPASRGKGIAAFVLQHLELWAKKLGYSSLVLETGNKQPFAVRLYEKSGYQRIDNYGQYAHVDNSMCFEKTL